MGRKQTSWESWSDQKCNSALILMLLHLCLICKQATVCYLVYRCQLQKVLCERFDNSVLVDLATPVVTDMGNPFDPFQIGARIDHMEQQTHIKLQKENCICSPPRQRHRNERLLSPTSHLLHTYIPLCDSLMHRHTVWILWQETKPQSVAMKATVHRHRRWEENACSW